MERPRRWTRLFVYGTLLSGQPNHAFLAGCVFLGAARTEPGFALVTLGDYPAMLTSGEGVVTGEAYAVTRAALKRLDLLEDHPHLYRRTQIRLADRQQANAYLITAEQAHGRPRIPSGDWRKETGEQRKT